MMRLENAAESLTAGLRLSIANFAHLWILKMAQTLDEDVLALNGSIRGAWRSLADPSLTSYDRREIRNYMKDAEIALHAGLKQISDRERARREAERVVTSSRRLDFRILMLDA